MTNVAREEVELVAAHVAGRAGVSPTGRRQRELLDAVARAMADAGTSTAETFLALLEDDRGRLDELVVALTVGESYFMRESRHIELLAGVVLPDRAEARGAGHRLRLWSAGCASGQEAYTLAIVLEEAGLGHRSEILATDVSEEALAAARRGVYGKWSLRAVDERTRRAYFLPAAGGYQVRPRLARSITFRRANLLDPTAGGAADMDVVLCRNVLVYLTPAAVEQVARRLVAALAPGGWMITASTDPGLDGVEGLEAVATPHGIVYRRATSGSAPEQRSQPPVLPSWSDGPPAPDPGPGERLPPAPPAAPDDRRTGPVRAPAAAAGDAGDGKAEVALVRALGSAGRLSAAADAAAEAIARFPLNVELRLLQAIVQLELGVPSEAATAAKAALYLDPGLVMAHLTLARAEQVAGDGPAARRSFRNALALLEDLPADRPVPLADGETPGRLASFARAAQRDVPSPTGTAAAT